MITLAIGGSVTIVMVLIILLALHIMRRNQVRARELLVPLSVGVVAEMTSSVTELLYDLV